MGPRWCVVAALLLLLPPASADFELHVPQPVERVPTNGDPLNVTASVTLDCPTLLTEWGTLADPVVKLEWEEPEGVDIWGPKTVNFASTDCLSDPQGFAVEVVDLALISRKDAPGLVPMMANITATLTNPVLRTATTRTEPLVFTVDYRNALLVTIAEQSRVAPRGRDVQFQFSVQNIGNADSMVEITLAEPSPWPVTLPPPTLVTIGGHSGTILPVKVTIGEGDEVLLTLRVSGRPPTEPDRAALRYEVKVVARRGSCDDEAGCSVASPSPAVGVLIFVLATVAIRRRLGADEPSRAARRTG